MRQTVSLASIGAHSFHTNQIEAALTRVSFEDRVRKIAADVELISSLVALIMGSERLRRILEHLLVIGSLKPVKPCQARVFPLQRRTTSLPCPSRPRLTQSPTPYLCT